MICSIQISRNSHEILSFDFCWSPRKLNEIIRGKRSVTAASAIELAEALGTTRFEHILSKRKKKSTKPSG
jgi:hypothetical protein